jgi:hypothetical protein
MELARWEYEFLKRYRADNITHYTPTDTELKELIKQDGMVYVISENNRAPYKIGYARSDIYKRFAQFRTFARKFYIHFVIGFFTGAFEELDSNHAKKGESFLHDEFVDYRMHFPKYDPLTDNVEDEGGGFSELFFKKGNGERITLKQIESGIMRALDTEYTKQRSKNQRNKKRLHPRFGYRCLPQKLERLKQIDAYVVSAAAADLEEVRAGQKDKGLRSRGMLTRSIKGQVKAHIMDNSRFFSVSDLPYTGVPDAPRNVPPRNTRGMRSLVGTVVGALHPHKKNANVDFGTVVSQRNGLYDAEIIDPAVSGSIDKTRRYNWYRVKWHFYSESEYTHQQILIMRKSAKDNPTLG